MTTIATKEDQTTSNRRLVLEAVQGLHNMGVKYIRTANIVELTQLSRQQVADAIKDLRDRGDIVSPTEGVYEPVFSHPPSQALSVTVLPDGVRKLEKGDLVMTLTPHEWAFMLAPLASGSASQSQIRELVEQNTSMAGAMLQLRRELASLRDSLDERPAKNGRKCVA